MSRDGDLCGMFGKVPQQADFVSLHMPESFTETWHAWLQAWLTVSREQLGEQWLDYYITSPAWRFAIAPGICGDRAAAGVMIPSVDEVGRYFPLVIAHLGGHGLWPAYLSGTSWFDEVERVACGALAEDSGYMRLIENLEALQPPAFQPLPRYRTRVPGMNAVKGWQIADVSGVAAADAAIGLLNQAYNRLLGGHSLWWTRGSDHVEPCLLISAGLPEPGQVAAMHDGEWEHWGWAREQVIADGDDQQRSPLNG
ncbi:MAG: type VI secretion system-associated protein TagF [Aquisalimonadaceae bacterium]